MAVVRANRAAVPGPPKQNIGLFFYSSTMTVAPLCTSTLGRKQG